MEKSQFWIDAMPYFFVNSSRSEALDLESAMVTSNLSSPRAKRMGPKGLRAESARAVTG